ncbi:MAG: SPASM domain-containing protein, partial [Gemmatimonadaceae bacterium]|nr:SPASM domain-containing protein [Gemmatimonadaceae bacterium]
FNILIRGTGESQDGKHLFFTREQYLSYWADLMQRHGINTGDGRVNVDAFRFHDRAGTLHRTDRGANLLNHGTVRKIDRTHRFYCERVDRWAHFMWDGTIRLCCMDYHGEVSLPNINDVSLVEYYRGAEYDALQRRVTGRTPPPEGFICTRCTSPGG